MPLGFLYTLPKICKYHWDHNSKFQFSFFINFIAFINLILLTYCLVSIPVTSV